MTLHYADTSALVKLVVEEPETRALYDWLTPSDRVLVSSDLTRTELRRAVARSAPERMPAARNVLGKVSLIGITSAQLDDAGRLAPISLRSLDAIHLAVALLLGDELDSVLTYDGRMLSAAEDAGLRCEAPGA